MSNTVEAIDSRKTQTGEQINDLEGRMVEITAVQQNTEKWKKKKKKCGQSLRDPGTLNTPTFAL